jgi:trigger factor
VSSEETEVTEEEVEEALEEIRHEQAVVELVERPAQLGDEVQLRVSGEAGDVMLVDRERISLALEEENIYIAPGFVEAILDMAPGEEKTFTLTLDEEFEDEELRGQDATFSVKLFEVYDRELPELDDALASAVGPFETIDELRDALRERMVNYKQAQTQEEYVNELVERLLDYADVKYPPEMVDDEVERMVEEIRTSLQNEQGLALEDALRLQGQTLSQLQDSLRPQAENRLEVSLVMREFIEREKLEVTSEQIQEKMRDAAPDAEGEIEPPDFNSPFTLRIYQDVLSELAFERLAQIAHGELEAEAEAEAEAEDEGVAPEPGAIIDVDAVEAEPEDGAEAQAELEPAEDAEDETPLAAASSEAMAMSEDSVAEVSEDVDTDASSEAPDVAAESEEETSASDSET